MKKFALVVILAVCGAGAAVFWAAGFVAARHGIDIGFTPADITFHRCFWAGLLLFPLAWCGGLRDLNGIGWGRGIVLTFFGGLGISFVSRDAVAAELEAGLVGAIDVGGAPEPHHWHMLRLAVGPARPLVDEFVDFVARA